MDWSNSIETAVSAFAGAGIAALAVKQLTQLSIQSMFDKALEDHKDKLARATAARKLILDHEMAFFDESDKQCAQLVPLVQDLRSAVSQCYFEEYARENLLAYLELVKQIRNTTLHYEIYIHGAIWQAYVDLDVRMQDHMGRRYEILSNISKGVEPTAEDLAFASEACDAVLRLVAKFRSIQSAYLQGLSSNS